MLDQHHLQQNGEFFACSGHLVGAAVAESLPTRVGPM